MPFNSAGTFGVLNPPFVPMTSISSSEVNGNNTDFATGLSNTLTRDGQGKPSTTLNWNGQRIDNIGTRVIDGSATVPSASFLNDTDTGLYLDTAYSPNTIGFAAKGKRAMNIYAHPSVAHTMVNVFGDYVSAANTPSGMFSLTLNANRAIGEGPAMVFNVPNSNVATTTEDMAMIAATATNATSGGSARVANLDFWGRGQAGTQTMGRMLRLQGSDNAMYLTGSYAEKLSGTSWANPSDARIKANVVDYTPGLREINQLRPVSYELNGKGGFRAGTMGVGVIAQEVMQVLPNTVSTFSAKLDEADSELTDLYRFDATEITWALVNAVKELNARLSVAEARTSHLTASTPPLSGRIDIQ